MTDTDDLRAGRMRAKAPIPHWEPLWSWEYVLDLAREFRRRGWSLNCQEIQLRERPMFTFIHHSGRQWDEVLEGLGLDPAAVRKTRVGEYVSKADVSKRFGDRSKQGKSLARESVSKDDMRLANLRAGDSAAIPRHSRQQGLILTMRV